MGVLIGPFALVLGGLSALSGIGSLLAGRGSERRAKGIENELYQLWRRYRTGTLAAQGGPLGGAQRLSQQAVEAFQEQGRPAFERSLTESVGDVVGGLGRRGGLVERTVRESGERFAESTGRFAAMQVPSMMQYALSRENTYLDLIAGLRDAAQARANAARRGFAGFAGLPLMAATAFRSGG